MFYSYDELLLLRLTSVPNAEYNDNGGYWAYPCDSKLNASISLTGISKPLSISDQDLNFGQVSVFSKYCVGAIIPGNTSGYWILGLAFLKNYYTVSEGHRQGNYKSSFPCIGMARQHES